MAGTLLTGQLLSTLMPGGGLGQAAWAESVFKSPLEPRDDTKIDPAASAKPGDLPEGDLTVEDVTIEGNRLVPAEDILNVVKTKRGDRFDREQVMRDLKAVNGMGYFDDRSLQAVPEMNGGGVLLKIRVQENAPVTQFAFQGNSVLSSEDLSKLFSDQLGKPQNLTQLSQAIDKVEQAYHEKGFMLSRVVDVKDDPDGSVSIKVDEGQIGEIKITGNKKTKDFIIRNALKLKAGQVYNEKQLTADLRKLYGNGYFQDIRRSLAPDPTNPEKYTLKVEVDEKRTGSIGLGGGVDTNSGPFGSFSFGDNNFMGKGQQLSFSSQIGTGMFNNVTNSINNGATNYLPTGIKTYNFRADWVEPALRGSNTSLGVSGFGQNYASMMVDQAAQRAVGTSVTLSRPLGRNTTGSLSFTGEQTTLKDFASSAGVASPLATMANRAMQLGYANNAASATAFAQGVRKNQLAGGLYMSVSPSLNYDTRDSMLDPHRGTTAKLSGGPSLGLTGSSFAKIGASISKYKQVTKETTLAFNTQVGSGFGSVPQFASYRLGGYNGMRGYRMFSDLGTGSGMLMSSVELRHKLPFVPKPTKDGQGIGNHLLSYVDKNVRGVSFLDFGGVSGNKLTNSLYNQGTMGASVGVGLRMNIPMVGLVRFDYGFPLLSTALGKMTPRFTVGFGDKF
jgi:outer membrane protein insertion porin family